MDKGRIASRASAAHRVSSCISSWRPATSRSCRRGSSTRFIAPVHLPGTDMLADGFYHRTKQCRHGADPVGHSRTVQIDAFPFIDVTLPMQRHTVGVFADSDVREQAGSSRPHSIGNDALA